MEKQIDDPEGRHHDDNNLNPKVQAFATGACRFTQALGASFFETVRRVPALRVYAWTNGRAACLLKTESRTAAPTKSPSRGSGAGYAANSPDVRNPPKLKAPRSFPGRRGAPCVMASSLQIAVRRMAPKTKALQQLRVSQES